MKNNISILGCGWLGLALAESAISKGNIVLGSTTSRNKLDQLAAAGIIPFLIDVSELKDNLSDFLDTDVLVIAITSKDVMSMAKLVRQLEREKVRKVIFISSTSVYPNTNGEVTEETQTIDSPLAEIEQLFIKSATKCTVLRFGGLYGYDRQPGNFIVANKPIANPEGYINFIHRDDCIGIIERIIERDVWGEILNACCDEHPTRREFYLQEAEKVNKSPILFNEEQVSEFKIIQNAKVKRILQYSFAHPNLID